jgi:hypothetical protein
LLSPSCWSSVARWLSLAFQWMLLSMGLFADVHSCRSAWPVGKSDAVIVYVRFFRQVEPHFSWPQYRPNWKSVSRSKSFRAAREPTIRSIWSSCCYHGLTSWTSVSLRTSSRNHGERGPDVHRCSSSSGMITWSSVVNVISWDLLVMVRTPDDCVDFFFFFREKKTQFQRILYVSFGSLEDRKLDF